MRKTIAVTVISGVLLASSLAQAGSTNERTGVYGTLGLTWVTTEVDLADLDDLADFTDGTDTKRDIDVSMVTGRIGYRINDYFGVEGEASFGLGDDSINETLSVVIADSIVQIDAKAAAEVTSVFAGYVVGFIPVSDQIDLFARAGYGTAKAKVTATASALGATISDSFSDSEDAFSYGFGGQYLFSRNNGVRIEYSGLGSDINAATISYIRRF